MKVDLKRAGGTVAAVPTNTRPKNQSTAAASGRCKMLKLDFWKTFFDLLGTQNRFDIPDEAPAHFWKTRIGFRKAWTVATILHGENCEQTRAAHP